MLVKPSTVVIGRECTSSWGNSTRGDGCGVPSVEDPTLSMLTDIVIMCRL